MSWQAHLLNAWLRLTEKPFLSRATNPAILRASFEVKAALFFRAPWGTKCVRRDLAGLPALWLSRSQTPGTPLLLYFHGGAHVFGSPRTMRATVAALAKRVGIRAVLPRYPLAPEAPFPAAIDHCMASYRALLDEGVDPAHIIVGGDSAGGNLALALLGQLCVEGAALPAGVFALSPLTDMTFSGASIQRNATKDVVLPTARLAETAQAYLGDHAPVGPRASPLFADFTGAPSVWLCAGDTEILLDDTLRMADRLKAQGVAVDLHVASDLPHVWPMFHNLLPEARATLDELAAWFGARLSSDRSE
ncbi:alpha/beta hydrolase [Tateyamaria sp.]|uniref:alpha/beta hydrolase n=1 Tax=Tateyamaria sp. TaxID=1929288 RepID=UPI0032A0F019